MNMAKRLISLILVLVMLGGMVPVSARATEKEVVEIQEISENSLISTYGNETEPEGTEPTVPAGDIPVTRAQWLQLLVKTFDYSSDVEIVPDNYYPDLSAEAEYYDDVLTAVYYGLVDVLPNSNLCPEEAATREFAAYTLNTCMGYLPEAQGSYTFSESAYVMYPDDIQVAIERGWFALESGAFLPEQAISVEERDLMVADAKNYLAEMDISGSQENTYVFKEGVIEITEEVKRDLDAQGLMITIPNLKYSLKAGDKIVIYQNGLAIPYQVVSTVISGPTLKVRVTDLYFEDAIESMNAQMVSDTDPANFSAAEGAELIFIEESTGQEYTQQQVIDRRASISDSIYIPKYTQTANIGSAKIKISVELKKSKVVLDVSPNGWTTDVSFWLDSDVEATIKVSCPLEGFDEEDFEIPIGEYGIPEVGGIKLSIHIDIGGSVSLVKKYHMRVGIKIGLNALQTKVSHIFKVTDKGSSFNAEVSAKAYLGVEFGFYGKAMPVRGYLEGEVGFQAKVKYTTYSEIEGYCVHFAAYLYAELAAKIEWGMFGYTDGIEWKKEIIKESNSPIKVSVHYEDGKQTCICTRKDLDGTTTGDPSKIADSGYSTSYGSNYFGSGLGNGSSTGYTSSGEPVIIYTYSLDDENKATITSYSGNATSLTIPLTLDGYDVIAIGESAFQDKTGIRTVIMQDNILTIGENAFEGCTNLRNLTLSESLTDIDNNAFKDCNSLTTVDIPDTVVNMGARVFQNCTSLAYVELSSSLFCINEWTFNQCTSLKEIVIPDSVKTIFSGAFGNCTALAKVVLSKNLVSMTAHTFYNCDALTSIEIPKSLEETYDNYTYEYAYGYVYGPFYDCDNLKNVTFEEGTTMVATGLFANCPGLEAIVIPETVTLVGPSAFRDCENLASVKLPSALTMIDDWAFKGCVSLTEIDIPDSCRVIDEAAFAECSSLSSVKLPKSLKVLYTHAFYNCDALTSIEIPKMLDEVYTSYIYEFAYGYVYGPFYDCDNLENVTFEEGTTMVATGLFANCPGLENIVIPDTVAEIYNEAFYNCDGLLAIDIPESVTYIGNSVFESCDLLTTVTWPSSLTEIPHDSFLECMALTTLNLPDTLEIIEESAFYDCDSLVTFTMPNSVIFVGVSAFDDCDGLTQVQLSENLTELSDYTFYDCDSLTSITIPWGINYLGMACFYDCDALVSVDMANSVTNMDIRVFQHCDNLKYVKLSRNLTTIPESTFEECGALEEIVIPYFITEIEANAFNSSPKLVKVVTRAKLTSIADSAFSYPNKTVFYGVPESYTQTWCTENGYTFQENTVATTALTARDTAVSMAKGTTYMLEIEITPNDFADTISFKSSNTSVVTVDETGKLTAVAPGTATIKVTVGGKSASCKVTVTQAVTRITLNKTTLNLEVPDTYQLTATVKPDDASNKVLEWTSSNEAAATVDQNGQITAVGNGTAVITATATDGTGVSASCTVTVVDPSNIPVSKITLDKTALSLEALETAKLTATVAPSNAANQELTWTSSNENVATVDGEGMITAVSKGTAVITSAAADGSGITASCTVTVINNAYIITDVALLESPHPYANNCSDVWVYTIPGAANLMITFDTQTDLEEDFDYLLIYDGSGELVGNYTGTALAGERLEIPGDTVKIKLLSDDSGSTWGFKVTSVESVAHTHDYESEVTDATCEDRGYTTYTCILCGDTYVDDYVDALGHEYESEVVEPTCEAEGYTIHTCIRCDDSYQDEDVAALGHEYESTVVEATCEERGYTVHICIRCEDRYEDAYVEALGHEYKSEVVEPTCTEQGCTIYVCSRCEDTYEDTFVAALGHDFGEWTAWENGLERRDCSRCDHFETREAEKIELVAPTVKVTNVASSGKIKLTWEKVEGAANYEVYRATSKTGTYTRLSTTSGTSLTNTSTEAGKTYYYKVRAVDANGNKSEFSSIVSRTCDLPRPDITLSNIASSGKIKISWAKIDGATKYEVYRSTDNKTWTRLSTTTGTSLTNTSTTAGTTYYYKVKAIASSSAANSAYSTVKSRTCDLPRPEITLSNVASSGKIKITWEKIDGAAKYEVYRSTDNQTWTRLSTTTGTSLTNTSTTAGKLYYYKVRAIHENSAANSAYSSVKSRTCDLARPTLTVKLNTSGKPVLTWTKIDGAVKYEIYRSTDNKTWTKLSTTTGTKLTNTSAKSGTTYYYKVKAIASNTAANSAYSTVKSIAAK